MTPRTAPMPALAGSAPAVRLPTLPDFGSPGEARRPTKPGRFAFRRFRLDPGRPLAGPRRPRGRSLAPAAGFGAANLIAANLIADCGHPKWPGWQVLIAGLLAAQVIAAVQAIDSPVLRAPGIRLVRIVRQGECE